MFSYKSKSIINSNDSNASLKFSEHLIYHVFSSMDESFKTVVFLCIGTDRSTGDSLGPLIGHKLLNICSDRIIVLGTLEDPVHAKNLSSNIETINRQYLNPFIIAIDACLGKEESVGSINISKGPIYPGAGVNKNLIPVGDINIKGIVNVSGYMEYLVLQNTRLNTVMKMADTISKGIALSSLEIEKLLLVSSFANEEI